MKDKILKLLKSSMLDDIKLGARLAIFYLDPIDLETIIGDVNVETDSPLFIRTEIQRDEGILFIRGDYGILVDTHFVELITEADRLKSVKEIYKTEII